MSAPARWVLTIANGTLVVFTAFGVYVFAGGVYEIRTAIAMTLRTPV